MSGEIKDKIVLEMGYTRKEFLQNFPSVSGNLPYKIKQNTIHLSDSNRQLLITLAEEPPRQIASLVIPKIHVTFLFKEYSKEQRELFMKHFRRHYHKGGG